MDSLKFDEIINNLTEADKSLATPLFKTKVFAHRVNNKILYEWVSKEIDGYAKDDFIPKYRKCNGVLVGTYMNGNTQVNSQPIPAGRYLENTDLENIDFRQGILSLESLITDSGGEIGIEHNAEIIAFIQQGIKEQGNEYFGLVNARTRISRGQVVDLIAKVRNALLDLILKLDKEFTTMADLERQPDKVEEIVAEIVINAGAGSIINTGDHNQISYSNPVIKGDKNSLKNHLKDKGVPEKDIDQLLTVVDDGYLKANSWKDNMLEKAKSGVWNIKVGAAASLLADAIKAYFGLN